VKVVYRIGVVVALLVAIGVVLAVRRTRMDGGSRSPAAPPSGTPAAPVPAVLPKLLDLGAGACIPCKMMAPILEEMKKTYAGRLDVEFIDVWKNPRAAETYGIKLIPTQIFYDASGTERFRHEGFFAKEDILAKWKELGVDLGESASR